MPTPVTIRAAVEGIVDRAIVRKLIDHAGGQSGTIHGMKGKSHLYKSIRGYNNSARQTPWMILVDLDRDADCAPPLRAAWLPEPARLLCFRVAVRAVESWLMADADSLARYLRVARSAVPRDPEALDTPKAAMVGLARRSRTRAIRQDMVPRAGSGRSVGPAYTSRLIEYVNSHWRPDYAAQHADSLRRAIERLQHLLEDSG